jgi:hypothetical protein
MSGLEQPPLVIARELQHSPRLRVAGRTARTESPRGDCPWAPCGGKAAQYSGTLIPLSNVHLTSSVERRCLSYSKPLPTA